MKLVKRIPIRVVLTALTVCVVIAWVLLLRPQLFGGPAAYVIVSGESMEPRLHDGDLVVAMRQSSYAAGDVIAYRIPEDEPGAGAVVIHRVVRGSPGDGYVTKGDNREGPDLWRPKPRDVLGALAISVPRVGVVLAFMRTTLGLSLIAGLMTFFLVSATSGDRGSLRRDKKQEPGEQEPARH